MKIGILYICTGKYKIFWKDFYLSCEKHFISEVEKHYFVFTDSESIEFENENSRIHRVYQQNLGWPGNTLRRYEMFLKKKEELKKFDFLFFFNANLQFLEKITSDEFVPVGQEKLVACLHPGYYDKKKESFTYERNSKSTAFIPKGQGVYYFAGGINGGLSKDFIEAMEVMDENIKKDFHNNIIAVWHDESHWNYFLNNNIEDIKILDPSYLYPEGGLLPFVPKILVRDKKILGGHTKLRDNFNFILYINEIKSYMKKLICKLKFEYIIKLKGGLGNQMFQYAHGRSLEFSGKKVIFDISFFENNKAKRDIARDFKLDNFNIDTRVKFVNKKNIYLDFVNKIKRKIGFSLEESFQGEKYFENIEDIIRKELTLKKELYEKVDKNLLNKILLSNSVSIHIRRTDYVTSKIANKVLGVCSLDYYKISISKIASLLDNPHFYIFSDDIEWVRSNLFMEYPFTYVSNGVYKDYEELVLMSSCKHNIIANSTFSWWAAWLNKNQNKIVVAPSKWFNDKTYSENNLVPKKWIRI